MLLRSPALLLLVVLGLTHAPAAEAGKKEKPIEQTGSQLLLDPLVSVVGGWIFPTRWEGAFAQPASDAAGFARIDLDPVKGGATYPGYTYTPPQVPGLGGNAAIVAGAFGSALGNAMVIASMEKARQTQTEPVTLAGGGEATLLAFAKGAREEAAARGLALDKTIWGVVPSELAVKQQFKATDAEYVLGLSRLVRPVAGLSLDNRRLMVIANLALYKRSDAGLETLASAKMAYVSDPSDDENGISYWSGRKGETLHAQAELAGRQMTSALLDRSASFGRAGVQVDSRRGEGLGVLSRDGTHAHMLSEGNVVLVLPVTAATQESGSAATTTAPAAN